MEKITYTNGNLKQLLEEFEKIHPGGYWKDGEYLLSKNEEEELEMLHKKILTLMSNDPSCNMTQLRFTICGWSEKHGYFRNKNSSHKTLEEAKKALSYIKKDTSWNIPTLIVKETWFLNQTNFITFLPFLRNIDNGMGFSDNQEVVAKSMCGNRNKRWSNFNIDAERVTY